MAFKNKVNLPIKRNIQKTGKNKRLSSQSHFNFYKEGLVLRILNLLKLLVGLITWQVLIIIILAFFYSPIKRIVEVLPDKFEKSNEISVWNLSLKIQEQAKVAGNPELANIIQGLSQGAIELLMQLGDSRYYVVSDNEDFNGNKEYSINRIEVIKELTNKGLLVSSSDFTIVDEDFYAFENFYNSLNPINGKVNKSSLSELQKKRLENFKVNLSDKGRTAYEIIKKVIIESISTKQ